VSTLLKNSANTFSFSSNFSAVKSSAVRNLCACPFIKLAVIVLNLSILEFLISSVSSKDSVNELIIMTRITTTNHRKNLDFNFVDLQPH